MRIIWDNLREVKDFINLVGLEKLSRDEEEWGGKGFIITGRDVQNNSDKPAKEPYTLHGCDYVIVTPYWRELSWLFRMTFRYVEQERLSFRDYTESFWVASKGFFLMNREKEYTAEDLVFFVIDFLADIDDQVRQEEARRRETEETK